MDFNSEFREKEPSDILKKILGWFETFLIAFLIYMVIHAFLFEVTVVSMSSMEDTLVSGQRLIIWKPPKYLSGPRRGDIVSFKYIEGKRTGLADILIPFPDPYEVDYIKRVIGLPGDEIDIRDGKVYINGKELEEKYVKGGYTDDRQMLFPRTVPDGKLFVMGDNRAVSRDSREFGFIDIDSIRGKAVFSIWPLSRLGPVK